MRKWSGKKELSEALVTVTEDMLLVSELSSLNVKTFIPNAQELSDIIKFNKKSIFTCNTWYIPIDIIMQ